MPVTESAILAAMDETTPTDSEENAPSEEAELEPISLTFEEGAYWVASSRRR